MVSGPRRIGRRGRPLRAVVGGEEPYLRLLSSGYQRSPGSARRLSCGPHAFVNVTRPPPAVRPSDHPSSIVHDRFIKGQNAGITQITPLGAMPPTRRHPRFRAAATSTTLQPFRRPISVSGRGSSGGEARFLLWVVYQAGEAGSQKIYYTLTPQRGGEQYQIRAYLIPAGEGALRPN